VACLRFASLGSGSSGNATLIAFGHEGLLIDCGFSFKELKLRLERLSFPAENISAVLCTHEHGDHAKGIATLRKRLQIPAYMSRGTSLAIGMADASVIQSEQSFEHGPFQIEPVTVPHDAREPLQFVVRVADRRVGVLTDLGSLSTAVIEAYSGCHALLVEANHDVQMLASGPYPYALQQRVGGPWGHLNNSQACQLLEQLDLSAIEHLVVGHISEKNNSLERVSNALAAVRERVPSFHLACQDSGFDWLELAP
jgi:phosphoribosyl 1,2-cyclic phosphodiesterase